MGSQINREQHCLDRVRILIPQRCSSAYSLSGHVSISVSSSYSIFERRRTARFLLQSVSLTFEGQSEVITPKIGYAAVRMCSITRELAPEDPVELNNEGHEDDDEPCTRSLPFSSQLWR